MKWSYRNNLVTTLLVKTLPAIVAVMSTMLILSSCFVVDALPGKKRPGGTRPPPIKIEPTPPPTAPPIPTTLVGDRLLRRITLELTGTLPTAEQRSAFAADPKMLPDFIDEISESPETARMLAEAHRIMWRLNSRVLPDLDRMALSNSTLAASLTATNRFEIINEPLLQIRKLLDDNRPYGEIFQRNYTIAHSSVLSLWGYTAGAQLWSGEPYYMAEFPDSRPAAGILNTQGFLAAFGSESQSNGHSRMAGILGRVACLPLESSKAHDFSILTPEQLSGDLSTLAVTNATCAGCHAQFVKAAPGISGYGRSTNLATWLARNLASDSAAGVYAGLTFNGTVELGQHFGDDHRVRSCTVRNMISTFMQRPFSSATDAIRFSQLLSELKKSDYNLRNVAAAIVKSEEFQWRPITRTQSQDLAKRASGLRFLSRRHFLGLGKILAPSATFSIPEELDPGTEELAGTTFRNPNGTYFHHLNRFIRQFATAIISAELASGSDPATRLVLGDLPAGSGAGIDAAAISSQITTTYRYLTGVELSDKSSELTNLIAIHAAGGGSGADSSSRDAWRAVLIGIMLGPDFVTY